MKKDLRLPYALVLIGVAFILFFPLSAQEEKPEDIMEMALEDLLNVEVTTVSKKQQKVSDIAASIVLVSRKEIETMGYQSLEEILRNVPGLYDVDDLAYGSVFGVRGFWSGSARNIIYLVNGVSQVVAYTESHDLPNFNIPVESIDRVEIVRGPMSVLYGSGAFFGAINIITNNVTKTDAVKQVSLSVGSMSSKRVAVRISGAGNNFSYSLNVGFYDTKGPDEPYSRMSSNPAFHGTTKKVLEDTYKYFNVNGEYKGFYTNISYNQSNKEQFLFALPASDGTIYDRQSLKSRVGFKMKLFENFTFDANITHHKFNWNFQYDLFHPNAYQIQDNRVEQFDAEVLTYFTPSRKFELTTGLNYKGVLDIQSLVDIPEFSMMDLEFNLDDCSIKTKSLFAQLNFLPAKKMRIVGGIRLEQMGDYTMFIQRYNSTSNSTALASRITRTYNRNTIDAIPNLAVLYSINDKNIVKFLYGKAINQPAFFHTYNQLLSGSPNLEPEFMDTIEANYIAILSQDFMVNMSVFYNKLSNLIVRKIKFRPDGSLYSFYTNAGEMTTKGAELTIHTNPARNLTFELSGTFQHTEDKRNDFRNIDVEYSPKILAYLKAVYKLNGFSISLAGRYIDKMVTHWDITKLNPDGSTGGRIGAEASGYFFLETNIRIDNIFNKLFFINVKITNLLDHKYLFPSYTNNNLWSDKGTIGKGRTLTLSIGKKF